VSRGISVSHPFPYIFSLAASILKHNMSWFDPTRSDTWSSLEPTRTDTMPMLESTLCPTSSDTDSHPTAFQPSIGTGNSGDEGSTSHGSWKASLHRDRSATKVSTDDRRDHLAELTGCPHHSGSRVTTGLWEPYNPTPVGSWAEADKAKQSISSPPEKPKSSEAEDQTTSKIDKQG
jgi:hypothetical protein